MHIPVGCYQINLIFTGAAVPRGAQVTYGLIAAVPPRDFDVVAAAQGPAFMTAWAHSLCTDIALTSVRVKAGPNDTGRETVLSMNLPGTGDADPVEPQVAVLVRKNTLGGGRKQRGRAFIPGVSDTGVGAGGVIPAGPLAVYQAAATAWLTALNANGEEAVILHEDALTSPSGITSMTVQALAATQRRRIRKVGSGRRRTTP